MAEGSTKRYGVHTFVSHEGHETHDPMESAIVQEKAIKGWKCGWMIRLIEESNPRWRDLYEEPGYWIPAFAGMTEAYTRMTLGVLR